MDCLLIRFATHSIRSKSCVTLHRNASRRAVSQRPTCQVENVYGLRVLRQTRQSSVSKFRETAAGWPIDSFPSREKRAFTTGQEARAV